MKNSKILIWNTLTNLIAAPVRFSLNLFLASCLLPGDYGAMVIPAVIVGISTILIDSGLKSSLIQKSTLKTDHSSTIFFVNLLVSVVLSLIFTVLAYPLELFFKVHNLSLLIILASVSLIIRSVSMVSEARLQIKGKYGALTIIEMISYVVGYLVAIYLAKHNYGPFSLISLALVSAFIYSLGLFYLERFIPKFKAMSKKLFWLHWRMGKNLLGQGLLEAFSDKIDEVILGRLIGVSKLGLYSKGREYSNTLGVIGSKFFARPWFSIMSKFSTNKDFFSKRYKVAYLLLIVGGMIMISANYYFGRVFIKTVLGKQWMPLASYFQYFIISTAIYYLVTFNKYTILALGKPQVNLKIEIAYSVFRLVSLIFVFFLYGKSENLVYMLICLDIISRISMIILQSLSLGEILKSKAKIFIMLSTCLLIFQGSVSLITSSKLIYGTTFCFFIIILFFNLRLKFLKQRTI